MTMRIQNWKAHNCPSVEFAIMKDLSVFSVNMYMY